MKLLVDTNLLLVFLVSEARQGLATSYKRTRGYSFVQRMELAETVASAESLITPPHILTEVSNFIFSGIAEPDRERVLLAYRDYVAKAVEVFPAAGDLAAVPAFRWLGLTDVGVASTAKGDTTVVATDDGRLGDHLRRIGVRVLQVAGP